MKLKINFFITALLYVVIIFFAGLIHTIKADATPKMVIEQTTVAFSPVIAGADVIHVFPISNKGDAALNIPGIYTN
jgi:hypothetical protein